MRMIVTGIAMGMLLTGCIVPEAGVRPHTYDFGHPPTRDARAESTPLPVLTVSEVRAPRYLESTYVYYRLAYADAQAPKPYAESRWAMPPSQLLTQRLKARLSQTANILSPGDARADLALRVELETFDHVFDTPQASRGVVRLRASLIRDRRFIAQQTFNIEQSAASPDAAGGVHALTQATDKALDALSAWVEANGAPLKTQFSSPSGVAHEK